MYSSFHYKDKAMVRSSLSYTSKLFPVVAKHFYIKISLLRLPNIPFLPIDSTVQGSSFLKIITCPTPRILKFLYEIKEEKSVQIHLPDW